MTDDIMLTIGDDGTASLYDDTYDITIHCESQEEQDEVKRILENKPHWIPVTERLPYAEYGESDNVLATCGHRDVEDGNIRWIKTLYFNGGNWCYPTGATYLEKVYAWMPLPEPYKVVTE